MPDTTTLLLIRHGHTGAENRILCGWFDISLSDFGFHQVTMLRQRLRYDTATASYSSSSRRTLETAAAAPERLLCDLQTSDALREIHCGSLEGMKLTELQRTHPDVWRKNLAQTDSNFRWPGGESYREFRARIVHTLTNIAEKHQGERVLIFTHSGVISQLLGMMHGLNPARWEDFRPGHVSITQISYSGGAFTMNAFDDDPSWSVNFSSAGPPA